MVPRCEGVRQRQHIVKRGLVANRGSLALGPQERSEGGRVCHVRYRHRMMRRRYMSPASHNMSTVWSQLVFERDRPTPSQLEVHGARPPLGPQILSVWRVLDGIFGVIVRVHVRKRAVRKSLCRLYIVYVVYVVYIVFIVSPRFDVFVMTRFFQYFVFVSWWAGGRAGGGQVAVHGEGGPPTPQKHTHTHTHTYARAHTRTPFSKICQIMTELDRSGLTLFYVSESYFKKQWLLLKFKKRWTPGSLSDVCAWTGGASPGVRSSQDGGASPGGGSPPRPAAGRIALPARLVPTCLCWAALLCCIHNSAHFVGGWRAHQQVNTLAQRLGVGSCSKLWH